MRPRLRGKATVWNSTGKLLPLTDSHGLSSSLSPQIVSAFLTACNKKGSLYFCIKYEMRFCGFSQSGMHPTCVFSKIVSKSSATNSSSLTATPSHTGLQMHSCAELCKKSYCCIKKWKKSCHRLQKVQVISSFHKAKSGFRKWKGVTFTFE